MKTRALLLLRTTISNSITSYTYDQPQCGCTLKACNKVNRFDLSINDFWKHAKDPKTTYSQVYPSINLIIQEMCRCSLLRTPIPKDTVRRWQDKCCLFKSHMTVHLKPAALTRLSRRLGSTWALGQPRRPLAEVEVPGQWRTHPALHIYYGSCQTL
ncbi:hypothetical protein CRM22_009687 [Opisthorchis felineus]|uniref:Uncharacterized protein n=1 Tax=Opisthorchis felineus TaxID=147828 RepID=A0A4S2L667_OPIFE|nr:hypothetical protein CRM22_009687 [Opisthorchis felineus]